MRFRSMFRHTSGARRGKYSPLRGFALLLACSLVVPVPVLAQQRDEQFYYPGAFNWAFLSRYPEGARLFNAFDYGHAVLYERLYADRGHPDAALEREYQYLTTDLLVRPPRFAIAEEAVMPTYAKIAWRAKQMFDWAHLLHRQLYDAYADEHLTPEARDSLIERITDYYLARQEYAFADKPKSMALMDDQYFSQVFRHRYEKFNGLIWAYHWLQVGLYEPLVEGATPSERKAGLQATVARFWTMLQNAPANMPRIMPMTSAIAPKFSAAHPRAAIIFDNLHMTHDIISDILAADSIPHEQKAAMINAQLTRMQDGSADVMSMDEWLGMGDAMGGVGAMGGPATGLLSPSDTLSEMGQGMNMGAGHLAPPTERRDAPLDEALSADSGAYPIPNTGNDSMLTPQQTRLFLRMLADSVIQHRILVDSMLRGLAREAGLDPSMTTRGQPTSKHLDTPHRSSEAASPTAKSATPVVRPDKRKPSMDGMQHR